MRCVEKARPARYSFEESAPDRFEVYCVHFLDLGR